MNYMLVIVAIVVSGLMAMPAQAAPAITAVALTNGQWRLDWDTPTNAFIVEQSSSLQNWTNVAVCSGSSTGVVSSTVTVDTGSASTVYFRLRFGLQVQPSIDAALDAELRSAIGTKQVPTNEIYDVELAALSSCFSGRNWCGTVS